MTMSNSAEPAAGRKRQANPRSPMRGRGVVRYAALLDATKALLQEQAPDAIGLYQIAEAAGVPPASVYHFFPTKEAAYMALAERCSDELSQVHTQPIEASLVKSWQDLFRIDAGRAMEFYNSHSPYLKIIYGGYGGVEARNIDRVLATRFANLSYDRLNRIFHMPYMKDPAKVFEVRLSILDSIWEISVRRYGLITQEYFDEAYNACLAYIRLYLPDHIEPRAVLVDAARQGAAVQLAFPSMADDPGLIA